MDTRLLEWMVSLLLYAYFSTSSSRDGTHLSCDSYIVGRFFTHWAIGEDLQCSKINPMGEI